MTSDLLDGLRNQRVGLLLSLLAVLTGFVVGGVLGVWEGELEARLRQSAIDGGHGGDPEAVEVIVAEAWTCYERAHQHWSAIGAATLAVSLLLAGVLRGRASARWVSAALGIGAVGYPSSWLLAGRDAPRLGGGEAAAESLRWLSTTTAGLLLVGVAAALVLISARLFGSGGD